MEFSDFLLRDQVVEIFLGTLLAFGLTRFAESLEKNVFRPFIRNNVSIKGQSKLGNVLSSFIGLLLVLFLVYLVYRYTKRTLTTTTQVQQRQSKSVNVNKLQFGVGKRPRLTSK